MITPDSPDRLYSARLRTAVVLTGSGTAGAYHAGVLRALHEAGVRTDLVAGRGIGAVVAMFAAVDGAGQLWEPTGVWKSRAARRFYGWRRPLAAAGWSLAAAGLLLLFPLALMACATVVGAIGLLLTLVGLDGPGSALAAGFSSRLGAWFAPAMLPTIVPRLVLLCVLTAAVALVAGLVPEYLAARRRRARSGPRDLLWRLAGSPMSARGAVDRFAQELWTLIKGVAPLQQPRGPELARRYVELLAENLRQPGFRELIVVLHDLDARHDLVFAFLDEPHRPRFFGAFASPHGAPRAAEAFDLSGVAREQAVDIAAAALALPVATEPHLAAFAVEGPWRGETHRLCDRPGALPRVLEEVAAAGAEQVILISAAPRSSRPHELVARCTDPRGTAGERLASFECAGLRDALEQFAGRFAGLYVIRPEHNPLGPLDFDGVYDDRSDRRYTLAELVDRGYEDAYRQFIEPIVGASGERMQIGAPLRAG